MTKKIFVLLVILLVNVLIFNITYAETTAQLENQKNNVNSQIDESKKQLNDVKEQKDSTLSEMSDLDDQIYQSENEIQDLEEKINNLNNDISNLTDELNKAQDDYNKQQELLEARLVAQYKAGNVTYLDVLLKSSNIAEFISNYYLISEITKYDTELLENIQNQKQMIENNKNELENKKVELKATKSSKEKAYVILANSKKQKQEKYLQLNEQEKSIQSVIDSKNEELKKISEEIEKNKKKIESISNSNSYVKYTGGVMAWPTRIGKRVNSVYAPSGRSDTGAYLGTAHRGVDIQAPTGTPIYAAASGVVVYKNASGYGGGWGLYVVISHGNGLYTRYAHGSQIPSNIDVGTVVDTNTCIMYAGSTGAAEGAHLHFEVCQNSMYNQINPCPFLGIENKEGIVQ